MRLPRGTASRGDATGLTREQVLAYRAGVSDLTVRLDDPVGCAVLDTGVQDTPSGVGAARALLCRVIPDSRGLLRRLATDDRLAVMHSVRGTMHLHRVADAGLLAAALRPGDAAELAVSQHGTFFAELQGQGMSPGEAFDNVASAMGTVMADGEPRTKGELSGAVTPLVDGRLPRWCEGCGVAHIHDGLFRYATLTAMLALVPGSDGARFRRLPAPVSVPDRENARRVLVRRFLRACGPAGPPQLAAWLGVSMTTAGDMWRLAAPGAVAVDVAGKLGWMHRDDIAVAVAAPRPPRLRLLPPYDPVTEIADREFTIPDPGDRKLVWRAAGNPGVLLCRGEFAGVWRARTMARRLVVTVRPFGDLGAAEVDAAVADAEAMADLAGLAGARVRLTR